MPKSKKRDYQIGYKKPPLHCRWKKGQSGNSAGRRKGKIKLADFDAVLDEVLDVLMPVNDNGRSQKMRKMKVLVTQTVNRGLKGDNKATGMILSHLTRRSARREQEPIIEDKAVDHAKKEFEAFFKEMAANLRRSPDAGKQDNDTQAEEPSDTKSDDKPPRSSEEQ